MDQQKVFNYLQRQQQTAEITLRERSSFNDGKPYPQRSMQSTINASIDGFLQNPQKVNRWFVIPGLRGVGKTTILAQIYLRLTKLKKDINLLYISLDEASIANAGLEDILNVYQAEILGNYFEKAKHPVFILVDEIQIDPQWAYILKTIYDRSQRVFIICTGSSAVHLQMDANVAGRRAQIETLRPLSFSEFQLLEFQQSADKKLQKDIFNALYYSSSAEEVYQGLNHLKISANHQWAKYNPHSLSTYLKIGTMPFALNRDQSSIHQDLKTIVEKVINTDLYYYQNFSAKTLTNITHLLHILATSGSIVALPRLSESLKISRLQIIHILNALVKAELLIKIPAYGSSLNSSRRPVKYAFTSAAIRAAYFDIADQAETQNSRQGWLLEDVASLHYYQNFVVNNKGSLSHYYSKNKDLNCDFILKIINQRQIAIEFGMGSKNTSQTIATMKKAKCSYGLVFSKSDLKLHAQQNVVNVPLSYFLMM